MQRPHLWSNSHCILSRNPLGKSISHLLTSSKFLLIKQQGTFEGLGKTKKKTPSLNRECWFHFYVFSDIYNKNNIYLSFKCHLFRKRSKKNWVPLCTLDTAEFSVFYNQSVATRILFFIVKYKRSLYISARMRTPKRFSLPSTKTQVKYHNHASH